MSDTIPGVLSRIVAHKNDELAGRVSTRDSLEEAASARRAARRDFHAALAARRPSIIAEAKKASPSKGLLAPDFDPARIARAYAEGGASCLSVLTDERFFQGSLADLEAARAACPLPALRKDFTLSEFHVVEAAAHGADAILLIAAILSAGQMTALRELAEKHGMAALVEVHDEEELLKAIDSGAAIIGVNNRNLHDFSVSLETSLRLADLIPEPTLRVSESGIHSPDDVRRLLDAGYQSFLVGEHLMRSGDPVAALRALTAA
ncbi:MAG: indole-3-glycerol phosphate synthase TrpC [Bryobacteraceae bacterium]